MESENAILAFAALAQPTRLDVFRLLMEHEPDGLPAGEVARRLDVPHNTMSTHLATLTRAGLRTVQTIGIPADDLDDAAQKIVAAVRGGK